MNIFVSHCIVCSMRYQNCYYTIVDQRRIRSIRRTMVLCRQSIQTTHNRMLLFGNAILIIEIYQIRRKVLLVSSIHIKVLWRSTTRLRIIALGTCNTWKMDTLSFCWKHVISFELWKPHTWKYVSRAATKYKSFWLNNLFELFAFVVSVSSFGYNEMVTV